MKPPEHRGLGLITGTVERLSFSGIVDVDSTVMIRVGKRKIISKRAFLLGAFLVACHIVDGCLTFFGMEIFGTGAEGNKLFRYLMENIGHGGALFVGKSFAIALSLLLMALSHRRLWIRWCLAVVIVIYLVMAVFPWVYILSGYYLR